MHDCFLCHCPDRIAGQLESTLLHTFIKATKLRRWLTKPGCPAAIKECKCLFDKAYAPRRDYNGDHDVVDEDFHDIELGVTEERSIPQALRSLISGNIVLRARHKHQGIVYTRSSTHLGNSLILFHPRGMIYDAVPGVIQHILHTEEGLFFAVRRYLDVAADCVDPFKPYPYIPAKLYQSQLAELELVRVEWVVSHFAQWVMAPGHVVVLSLSKVSSICKTRVALIGLAHRSEVKSQIMHVFMLCWGD